MIFGMGATMGWTAQDVKAASLWEFFAAWRGYVDANSPKKPERLTDDEADALWGWIEQSTPAPADLSTMTYWLDGDRLVPAGVVTFKPEH